MKSFGTITPSSNVMVERVTLAMTRDIPGVSPHFARFGFAGPSDTVVDDYHWPSMLGAAQLLADAHVDLICWNGSKGGELGFDRDRELCRRITEAHGVPAVTSVLALDALLRGAGIGRIAFVTPFGQQVNDKIVRGWSAAGYNSVADLGAGLTDNFSYSTMEAETLKAMARQVAESKPDAILYYCTNLPGAGLCAQMEAELGIPVLDSVSAGVWAALNALGLGSSLPGKWGRLLS
ncbi:maleate cis-trans isomerase family protein [Devosia sp. A16]|uniref:maleate cis-trans isomerase family protein n=1 Tax=Devosia sp. A16 TaxID=1736675 RepID=UPI0006D77385|nr:aspartate/glutamate racemase family protein [Devosia sp. A16]